MNNTLRMQLEDVKKKQPDGKIVVGTQNHIQDQYFGIAQKLISGFNQYFKKNQNANEKKGDELTKDR